MHTILKTTSKQFDQDDVDVSATEVCYKGFLAVEKKSLRHRLYAGGWSNTIQREVLLKDEAVGILLYDPHTDDVVMVRQFRVGALSKCNNPWLLELVAGMVEPGEDSQQVAIRESLEEANCIPANLIKICTYLNSPGTSNEMLTLYCGQVDSQPAGGYHGLSDENEDIEVVVLPFGDVIQGVIDGNINNAMSIIAIQWLQLNKVAVQTAWTS